MGRNDHGLLLDSKDLWWVFCPNSNNRLPLSEKPKYCPLCGERIESRRENDGGGQNEK
jgi:hypothetical protein